MSDSALFVMDIQNDFTGENARMPIDRSEVTRMIQIINETIEEASFREMLVVYIANEFSPKDIIGNFFRNHAAIKGREGSKLDSRLKVINHFYFPKQRSSAFTNKDLVEELNKRNIKQIFIVGVFAEGCVKRTATTGLNLGYKVMILDEAIAGKNTQIKNKVLKKLKSKGIIPMSLSDFKGH